MVNLTNLKFFRIIGDLGSYHFQEKVLAHMKECTLHFEQMIHEDLPKLYKNDDIFIQNSKYVKKLFQDTVNFLRKEYQLVSKDTIEVSNGLGDDQPFGLNWETLFNRKLWFAVTTSAMMGVVLYKLRRGLFQLSN